MTGPPLPRPIVEFIVPPGEIGNTFAIGVSPIGIPGFDPWVTVISQYANSPILDAMILEFNAAMDMTMPIQNFYDMVWNVLTAQGYGLDVWGRIVGVQRTVQIPGLSAYFGFQEANPSWQGFGASTGVTNTGVFFTGETVTTNVVLADADFRVLILAKAASNISDGSIESVNAILLALFPHRGDAYVVDNLNMSVTYTFGFALTSVELAIITLFAGFMTAAGVVWQITSTVQLPPGRFSNFAVTGRPALPTRRDYTWIHHGSSTTP